VEKIVAEIVKAGKAEELEKILLQFECFKQKGKQSA